MGRRGATQLALAATMAAALVTPTAAHGTVTIGSNLGRAPDVSVGCAPSCTVALASLTSTGEAPGGLVSPANGTVILWRIRVGTAAGSTALRVVRPLGGGLSTGAGTSATVTPPLNATTSYPTGLPITIGERIGVEIGAIGSRFFVNSTGTMDVWSPPLADGGPGQAVLTTSPREIAINADIEPTSAFTVDKVKPGKGGKVNVTATLPNPGILAGGDKQATLAAAAAGKKKVKYLKRSRLQIGAAVTAILLVKPTKAARQVLAVKGTLRTKLKLAFTPTGGSPSTRVIKVKLKR